MKSLKPLLCKVVEGRQLHVFDHEMDDYKIRTTKLYALTIGLLCSLVPAICILCESAGITYLGTISLVSSLILMTCCILFNSSSRKIE
jgi:hypothetical protein